MNTNAILDELRRATSAIENVATDAIARLAPWCAPIPTAYLVGRATVVHLHWPVWVGVVAALIVESLGLATTATALELREYNRSKRKADPGAPFALAGTLVVVYLVVAIALTVALDTLPALAVYSPAIFPLLSLTGVTTLAIRGDHRRRLAAIEDERQARKESRQAGRQSARQAIAVETSGVVSNNVKHNANLDALQAGRKAKLDARLDALLDVYRANPDAGPTEAARAIGVSRQTVYTYNERLAADGKLRRNSNGWEVL